jgi:hypothetical protein
MSTTLIRALSLVALITAGTHAWAAEDGAGKRKGHGDGELRAKVMEKFDANHDGKLDESERAAAKEAMKEHRGEHRGTLFDRLDANHDGSISREEFMAAKREHEGHKGGKN